MTLSLALVFTSIGFCQLTKPENGGEPDKIVEIFGENGTIKFVEKDKEKPEAVTLVVGQSIRWTNKDSKTHRVICTLEGDDKPIFDTGPIKSGASKDLLLNIDIYRRAGGKTANFVMLKYHTDEPRQNPGEIVLLSAARRGN